MMSARDRRSVVRTEDECLERMISASSVNHFSVGYMK